MLFCGKMVCTLYLLIKLVREMMSGKDWILRFGIAVMHISKKI